MSISQQKIIQRLLNCSLTSSMKQQHSAALCIGNKILTIRQNSTRSKFGQEIKCSGHAEMACLHNIFPEYFSRSCVLQGKRKKREK